MWLFDYIDKKCEKFFDKYLGDPYDKGIYTINDASVIRSFILTKPKLLENPEIREYALECMAKDPLVLFDMCMCHGYLHGCEKYLDDPKYICDFAQVFDKTNVETLCKRMLAQEYYAKNYLSRFTKIPRVYEFIKDKHEWQSILMDVACI